MKLEVSRQILEKKKSQIWNFVLISPVGADLFHSDRQTDGRTDRHDEANGRNFANAPKMGYSMPHDEIWKCCI